MLSKFAVKFYLRRYREVKDPRDAVKGSAGVLISGDQGLTWRTHGNLTAPGTWQSLTTVPLFSWHSTRFVRDPT